MVRRFVIPGVVLAAAALLATSCSRVSDDGARRPAAVTHSVTAAPTASASPSGSPSASSSSTPSATPTQTRDPLDLGDKTFKVGAKGKRVRALQLRLAKLRYDPGPIDSHFGPTTLMAVWAFQKVNDIKPTGTIGHLTRAAFDDPAQPKVLKPKGPGDRVEINLTTQVLTVYHDGEIQLISHISSGSGLHYCDTYTDDDTGKTGTACGVAVTPTGDYRAGRRIAGWRHSKLGYLYNPVYFNGGIAVHGEPSVPVYPASHGCVRIPMHTSTIFPRIVKDNERIYVRRP